GHLDRGAVLEADEAVAALRDGAVVGVMERPDRLEVRGVVALRVVRAAPEHVAGTPRAAGHEPAVVVLRAGHLEGQLGRRLGPLALDIVAVGVAVAADEWTEPPALADEGPEAALRTGLARARLLRRLVARQRPRLLVLGVHRAGQEAPVAPEPDDHGMPERADLVRRFGREVAAPGGLADLVDPLPERWVEGLEQRHPRP